MDMNTIVLIALIVFSFIVGRFIRLFETPHFIFSGMIYLLFGLLLGPSVVGIGLINDDLLYKLEPMEDLLTGASGFLLGLRVRLLFQNQRIFISGVLTALVTFFIMVLCLFAIADFAVEFREVDKIFNFTNVAFLKKITSDHLWLSFGIGATACSSSLLGLGAVSRFQKHHSEITKVLGIMAPSLQCTAIVILGACLVLAHYRNSISSVPIELFSYGSFELSMGQWFFAGLFSAVLCAMLFSLFIGKQSDTNRIILAAVGAITFGSGIGVVLNISSLFVCLVSGAVIGVFSSYAKTLKDALIRLEEPIFVLLLIIGGANWELEINRAWMLPCIYLTVRLVVFSSFTHKIYNRMTQKKISRLGQGLLGQDLIAVAMALSLSKAFQDQAPDLSQLFLTTVFGSIFINDIIANSLLKKVILDNEQVVEVKPIPVGREKS